MSDIRKLVRRVAPMALRRSVAALRRNWQDARAATTFADKRLDPNALRKLECVIVVEQPIRRTAHFAGKLHNLQLAATRLNGLCVEPSGVVSFWRAIGRPTARNGFQIGRAIIDNRLSADIGGGLCQVASLLYELGLRSGAAVLERHAHSRDLYTEETRFTPLGLDAAIVWGFKDVRWRSSWAQDFALGFDVVGETLRGRIFSAAPMQTHELGVTSADDVERRLRNVEVHRRCGAETSVVSRDAYVIDPS